MNTPVRISADEFVREYVKAHAGQIVKDRNIRCRECETVIERVPVTLSIHHEEIFSCTGPGTVLTIVIPFCPKCEQRPDGSGCLHVPGLFELLTVPV